MFLVSTHVIQVLLELGVQLGLGGIQLVLAGNMVYIHIWVLEMGDVVRVLVYEGV